MRLDPPDPRRVTLTGITRSFSGVRALKGVDLSLDAGRIGLGSFFNTAKFRNFKLTR